MTKGRLKGRKRNQEKAKSVRNFCHEIKIEVDRKEGEKQKSETLPLPKRALPSDEENSLDDHVQKDSIKKRKKSRKDRGVNTSETSVNTDGKHQRKSEEKEKRMVEFTGTANVTVCEESDGKEKSGLDSDSKKKELKDYNREHSKRKTNKETKETKVEVSEKKRKRKQDERNFYEVQQDVNQIGDGHNICDSKNVDDEFKDKKKKKKREKEIELENTLDTRNGNNLELSEEVDSEITDSVKKKKKKKSKHQLGEASKSTIHPGVDYLHTWHFDRSNWNFKKVRQVWLLQNMFDQEQVSKIFQCLAIANMSKIHESHLLSSIVMIPFCTQGANLLVDLGK